MKALLVQNGPPKKHKESHSIKIDQEKDYHLINLGILIKKLDDFVCTNRVTQQHKSGTLRDVLFNEGHFVQHLSVKTIEIIIFYKIQQLDLIF